MRAGFVVIEVGEFGRKRGPAPPPTPSDLRLAERLAAEGDRRRIAVQWLVNDEVEVRATSWIGVVRFSSLEVRIVPKLIGGALPVLRMLEYVADVGMIRRLPSNRPLPADGRDLFDLICLLLAEETHGLLRDGLLREYRPTEDTLTVVRGRLRPRDQYLRRFGRLDTLECAFDEYDSDNPNNQLVGAALGRARRRVRDTTVKSSTLRLAGLFDEACVPPTTDALWYDRTIQYDRRNSRYRPAHELSKLVLRGLAFDDLYDTSAGDVSAFLIDMNVVFERFVTRLVHDALEGSNLHSSSQKRVRAVINDDETGRSYSTIRPDLVVQNGESGRSVPIDIKYKLYDERKLSTDDIYQAFLYAYAIGRGIHECRAGVIYPASTSVHGPLLSIRPMGGPIAARIIGAGLDVPNVLDALNGSRRTALLDEVRQLIKAITGFGAR